ncbi:hypothetical protein BOX15_Mlig027692g1 [Macrostomum lignano]|uniref:non-specific serine/threonine protein kinase n=1 Tax=Macrostomum lignano TaxID=282301 RepID=A0A267EA24_9PLAT|nr:hypothetical protein BOX15_Mlig027692g1 [Macrostomum lignano]
MTSTPPMSTGANVADDSNPVERWFKAIDCARMSLVKEAYPAIDNVDVTKALPFGPKNTLHKDATALHLASYIGHKDIVRFLISSKADPNASTSLGYRPIHFAASEGHVTTVDILLNAGAEVSPLTADGDTPVALALKWGMRDTVRKLLNSGATLDGLDDASLKKYAKRGFLPSQEAASPTRQSAAPSAGGRKGGGNVRQQQQQRHHYQGAGGGYSMGDSSTQRRWRELTSKFADAEVGSGGGADDSRSAAFTAVARCVRRLLADCRTEERLEARAATLASALRSAGPDLATAGDLAELLEMLAFDCGFPVSGSLADCLAGLRLRCRRIREGPGAWAVRLMRTAQDPSLDSHSVDASLCLCNALLSMEQAECTGRLAPAAEEFINQTLSALEGTEEPRHLVQLLALVRLSSELFESNFLAKFEQFADVLIGWSIDPGDSTEFALSKRLAACLTSLGRLWRANSNYTWQLLDSLVEDVSVFVNEELPSALAKATSGGGGARADSPVETAMAAAPLLETFATVLTALDNASCRQADDADSASLNLQRLIGLLSRLSAHLSSLSAADLALCLGGGDQLRLAANQAIVSLLNAIKRRPGNGVGCLDNGLAEQLLNYLCDQLPAPGSQQQQQKQPMLRFPSNVYLTSLIELMSDLSTLTGPSLPVRSLFSAIGPYSVLHCAKLSPNPLLVRRVLSLFSGFIRLDDFRLTDAIYQTLISDLEQCLRVLVRLCGSDFEVNLVQENGFRDKRYSGSEAESLALFNCLALRELGRVSFADARPCLVRLQPPLFDLLATGYLPLHDAAVMRQQPRMHWALLRALQSHCQAHAYFYAYSPFCADSRTIGESDAVAAAASEEVDLSVRLQQLLQCLGALLASPGCPPKSAACAVACLTELAAAAVARDRRHSRRLFASPEIQLMLRRVARSLRLQSAPAYHSAAVRLMAACLSGAAAATSGDLGLGDEQYRHTFEVTLDSVFALLSTSDESLAAECLKLISLVPMEIYMRCLMAAATLAKQSRCLDDDVGQDAQGSSDLRGQWLGLRHHMMRTCEVTFSGPNLRLVLKYLLEGAKQPPFLYGLFLSCTPAARETKLAEASPDFASLLGQSRHVLSFQWFWATWEVSWFCVLNKLKVPPWNRAQDTFLAIEDALNRIVNQRLSANPADWHRSYCVLLFMEQLEKLVFNAYEGCALLSGLSHFKSVKYFFRTNKSTCLEWFHRTRPIVMQLCDRLDSPELVAREAFALLGETDASRYANQDDTLLLLVKSLCRMGQADCLHGLYAWCETRLGRRLLCVRAAAERADSKLESALQLYEQHLQDLLMNGIGRPGEVRLASKQTSGTAAYVRFCVTQIAECHEQLGNSRQLLAWQERLRKYAAEHALALPADCFQVPGVNFTYQACLAAMGEWSEPPLSSAISALPSGQPESGAVYSHVDRLLYSVATAIDPNQSSARASAAVVRSLCHGLGRARAVNWPTDLVPELYEPLAKLRMLALPCSDDNAEEDSFMQQQLDQVALNPITSREGLMSLGMLRLREAADRTALLRQSDPVQQRQHREMNFGVSLPTVRWCIRQSNFATAEALLLGEIDKVCPSQSFSASAASADSGPDLLAAVESVRLARVSECDLMSLERAAAKLLWRRGQSLPGLYCLAAGMSRSLAADAADPLLRGQKSRLNAKSVLTLVKWIRSEAHSSLFSAVLTQSSVPKAQPRAHQFASVSRSLAYLCDLTRQEFSDGAPKCPASVIDDDSRLHSLLLNFDTDALVGKLLLLASKLCPLHAKAWHGLASWCYKEARRTVLDAANRKPNVELTQAEKETALSLLPATVTAEEQTRVLDILGQVFTKSPSIGADQSAGAATVTEATDLPVCTEAAIESALRSQLPGRQLSERSLRGLQSVWRQCCQRVFALHHSSAKSYFTYLRLAATGSDDNGLGGSGSDQSPVVSATLRLLRLLVKHPGELADCLLEGFGDTPTGPWRAIIPQLFSRLSHPYPAVQQCLTELLIRIGADYPHLVVFPAIVGSSAPAATEREPASAAAADANPEDEAAPEDDQAAEAAALDSGVLWCVSSICDKMTAADPALLGQVRLFVDEMRRITVLWDELWLGAISQQLDDTARRVDQLDEELRRLATSDALSAADKQNLVAQKHEVFFMPILYTLERLSSITSVPAETPHETWFQATFSEIINETIDAVRAPSDPGQPHATWQAIKHLYQFLQQKIRRHSPNGAVAGGGGLSLAEISPALARLRATRVPMPGLGAELTLDGIQDEVQILPTKTKPKRLHFRASNGRVSPYLFKGLEDLHLDERIMQFLGITNALFARLNKLESPCYAARTYSVTPLGLRSGLIQMVETPIPLFTLYKRWQAREAMMLNYKPVRAQPQQQQQQQQQQQTEDPSGRHGVARPSELFFNKMRPALEAKGIVPPLPQQRQQQQAEAAAAAATAALAASRKDWPLSVCREVFAELVRETPNNLLSKELWLASLNAADWWRTLLNYSRSVAVMSIIGYVIGLGDRHLDNVLIDVGTGEIVHIDYNVCFEKGRNLKVPERVPFRLTQNLEAALGLTGVEGVFRLSAEKVLHTMRSDKEMLLTLLEAFVYDPLVDWTPGVEGGYTGAHLGGRRGGGGGIDGIASRRQLEIRFAWKLMSVRLLENSGQWRGLLDRLAGCHANSLARIRKVRVAEDQLAAAKEALSDACAVRAYITDGRSATAAPGVERHPIEDLDVRYQRHRSLVDAAEVAKRRCQDVLAKLVERKTAQADAVAAAATSVDKDDDVDADGSQQQQLSECQLPDYLGREVRDFLAQAGKQDLAANCHAIVAEMRAVLREAGEADKLGQELLSFYRARTVLYPGDIVTRDIAAYARTILSSVCSDWSAVMAEHYARQFDLRALESGLSTDSLCACLQSEESLRLSGDQLEARLRASEREARSAAAAAAAIAASMDPTAVQQQLLVFVQNYQANGLSPVKAALLPHLLNRVKRLIALEQQIERGSASSTSASSSSADASSLSSDDVASSLECLGQVCRELSGTLELARYLASAGMGLDSPVHCPDTNPSAAFAAIDALSAAGSSLLDVQEKFASVVVPETAACLSRATVGPPQLEEQLAVLSRDQILPCLNAYEDLCCGYYTDSNEAGRALETWAVQAAPIRNQVLGLFEPLVAKPARSQWETLLAAPYALLSGAARHLRSLLALFQSLELPEHWYSLDCVNSSASLLPLAWNTDPTLLDTLLTLLVGQCIAETLAACRSWLSLAHSPDIAASLAASVGSVAPLSETALQEPIRRFLGQSMRRVLLGMPSTAAACTFCCFLADSGFLHPGIVAVSADELSEAAVGQFGHPLAAADSVAELLGHLASTETRTALASRQRLLQLRLNWCRSLLHSYHWLHEDALLLADGAQSSAIAETNPESRRACAAGMLRLVEQFDNCQMRLNEARQRLMANRTAIQQRMRWAGAQVADHLANFEAAGGRLDAALDAANSIMSRRARLLYGLADLELTRTRGDRSTRLANEAKAALRSLVPALRSLESQAAGAALTDTELGVAALAPGAGIELNLQPTGWQLSESLMLAAEKQVAEFNSRVAEARSNRQAALTSCLAEAETARVLAPELASMVGELRGQLKVLAKDDPAARHLWRCLRQLHRLTSQAAVQLAALGGGGGSSESSSTALAGQPLEQLLSSLESGSASLAVLTDALFRLPSLMTASRSSSSSAEPAAAAELRAKLLAIDFGADGDDAASVGNGTVAKDNKSGAAPALQQQERNSFALGVWRRIKAKLDGDLPDEQQKQQQRLSVEDQVSKVIREAVSPDNLAQMYEGWTAWV